MMPRNIREISVFVSGPSDTAELVKDIKRTAATISRSQGHAFGYTIRVLHWESDTYPDVGADAQSVINHQIGTDYDIMIGVFLARLGTPTDRAESGSAEEFYSALQSRAANGTPAKIMLYFGNTGKLPASKAAVEQLADLIEFRENARSKGALDHAYESKEHLLQQIENHLSRAIADLLKIGDAIGPNPAVDGGTILDGTDRDDPADGEAAEEAGILDLTIEGEEALNRAGSSLTVIAGHIESLGTNLTVKTAEIEELSRSQLQDKRRAGKRLVDDVASELELFAQRVNQEAPGLRGDLLSGIEQIGQAARLQLTDFQDSNASDAHELRHTLDTLLSHIDGSMSIFTGMKDEVDQLPRLTARLSRSRKMASQAITTVVDIINDSRTLIAELIGFLDEDVPNHE